MNQIPNIEKTMRRGIKLIAGRIEALHPQYFLDETTYKHDVKGTMDVVKGVMADIEETLHQQLQKALTCGKDMGDGSICGCKLDCHLHDWRQREEIQKAREEEKERIKSLLQGWEASERTNFDSDEEYQLHRQKVGAINWYTRLVHGWIDDVDHSELDQDTELLNSVKEDWDKQAKNAMNGLDQDVSK